MTLLAVQTCFLDHVIDAGRPPDPLFAGKGQAGLAIYRNAYRARLISCLRTAYDQSWSWMGDARFDRAATAYVAEHISHSWSLDDYGADFAGMLSALFPDDPEIADLARLEWAMQAAFVQADGNAAEHTALLDFARSGKDMNDLRLRFLPGFAIWPVSTNAAAIWRAIQDEAEMPGILHYTSPHSIIIWRTGFSPHFRDIDDAEADALSAMLRGTCFGDMCDNLPAADDGQAMAATVGLWLGRWINDGLVEALY